MSTTTTGSSVVWRVSGITSIPTTSGGTPNPTKGNMGEQSGLFPVSVIIAGFCIMSFAYLICFCCCLVQFLMRQGRRRNAANNGSPERSQEALPTSPRKNEKLRSQLWNQYENSLKRFRKQGGRKSLRDASCAGACSICFEEYSGDPSEILVGYLKPCGHYFHFECIWQWLESRQSCPLCRTPAHLKETDIKGLALRHIDEYKLVAKELERKAELQREATKRNETVITIETVKSRAVSIDPKVTATQAGTSRDVTLAGLASGSDMHVTSVDAGVVSSDDMPGCSYADSSDVAHGPEPTVSEDELDNSNEGRHTEHGDTSPIVQESYTARNESRDYENPAFEHNDD